MTYHHLMLDLETWGVHPGCAIRSLGAVYFGFDGQPLGPTYYANVDTESCVALGLQLEPRVVEWWGEQSPEAQAALDLGQLPITDALAGFLGFFEQGDSEVSVWSHGATFDIPITDYAMQEAGLRTPWNFQKSRDTRTLIWLAGELGITVDMPHAGIRHQALDDAKTRALQMIELHRRIAGGSHAASPQAVAR